MKDLSNENVVQINNNGISYIQFKRLLEYKDILTHCFTLKPLDFGHNSNYKEKEQDILQDYKKICNEINIDSNCILRPYQTHTNVVKEAKEECGVFLENFKDVDGIITNRKNKALSLTFADCTPIFLFDPIKNTIGNIHSGWQGTVKQIVKNAINKMIETYNCNPKDIICCIGPTIRKCHFEVDEDVKNIFLNTFSNYDDIITLGDIKDGKQKYYIDTVKINTKMLLEMGVKEENIIDSKICSVCENKLIHSYRKERDLSGRCTAIMMLK